MTDSSSQENKSIYLNNNYNSNNNTMFMADTEKNTPGCSQSLEERSGEDLQKWSNNLNLATEEIVGGTSVSDEEINHSDSDEMLFVNSYEEPITDDEDQQQLSSPSSLNSEDCFYAYRAYRGRIGMEILIDNNNDNNNRLPFDNRLQPEANQHAEDPDEETDFLEMDFEPDTNSEIENEAKSSDYVLPNGCSDLPHSSREGSNIPEHLPSSFNFLRTNHQSHSDSNAGSSSMRNHFYDNSSNENENINKVVKNTGTKPKQPSTVSANKHLKNSKQHYSNESAFVITNINNNNNNSTAGCSNTSSYNKNVSNGNYNNNNNNNNNINNNEDVKLTNRNTLLGDCRFLKMGEHSSDHQKHSSHYKSPSKSSTVTITNNYHHHHKHQKLQSDSDLNEQFLFDIEPLKPRNSITIYTTNCDEKILVDALNSLKLEPNRETISSYFNRSRLPANPIVISNSTTTSAAPASTNCELDLVDYIIYKSKLNCNYKKLIELIQKACKNEDEENYGSKKFDINFYTLDLFSNQPEMIDINVNEIVRRWTPQTDLRLLQTIKNKYFYQSNVLGKVVNIIRKINQQPAVTFKDNETIKIPQFWLSGYITLTLLK